MNRFETIEGTISHELLRRYKEKLDQLEYKVSSVILERDDYAFTLGQIAALRECNEEVKDLTSKLL